MKLLRYGLPGHEKPGILDSEGCVRDLSDHVSDIGGSTLLPENLLKISKLEIEKLPKVSGKPQADLRLGACVSNIGKFICVGLNYSDHAKESGMAIPPEPVIFNKWTSAVCGPDDDVIIPRGSNKSDWEVELGVVIGAPGKYIEEADADKHIAGYCVINDVSEREFQLERSGTWDKGKGCDTFGPTGPWLVTKDEIPNPNNLKIWLELDGVMKQNGNTDKMVYQINFLISYISKFMSLHPGDIISTGTPPGVGLGFNPPVYLKPGNKMRLGIEGLGIQTQNVIADSN